MKNYKYPYISGTRCLLFFFMIINLACQHDATTTHNDKKTDYSSVMKLDTSTFNDIYTKYKEKALYHRRFKHRDVDFLVNRLPETVFDITTIGYSSEGRSIYELAYGKGDVKVMLWSQMHGDEPTATAALFDLFNFLKDDGDEYNELRELLNNKLKIHFIPMLNPDGAELFIRRNAQSIDLNRDARVGQTVEGKLLLDRGLAVKPDFGFNLHDQSIYYHVPDTKNPVAISMLAPAFNSDREVNDVRGNAMKLIVGMNALLQQYVPDAVAKYDDTYSPRGFGDKFQSWGASTVLIESGGMKGDPEKQEIRRLNFVIILNALMEIAQGSFAQYEVGSYDKIPFNGSSLLHDVMLRNVEIGNDSVPLKVDVAIRRGEMTVGNDYYVRSWVEDMGDLKESFGYDEIDADGLYFTSGKVFSEKRFTLADLTYQRADELLRQGFMAVSIRQKAAGSGVIVHDFPIHLYVNNLFFTTPKIELGGTANFYLADKAGKLKYAVLNGYLIDLLNKDSVNIKNRIHE